MPLVPSAMQPRSDTARNVFRVLGIVFVLVGLAIFIPSLIALIHSFQATSDMNSPNFGDGPPVHDFVGVFGGFLIMGFLGMPCLSAGFAGAVASYEARQVSPAITSVASAVRAGMQDPAGDGPFCSACGTRAPQGASFCSKCGAPLGQA